MANQLFGIDAVLVLVGIHKTSVLYIYATAICKGENYKALATRALYEAMYAADSIPLYCLSFTISSFELSEYVRYIALLTFVSAGIFYLYYVWKLPHKWNTSLKEINM
jgi:hypothetical protein